MLYTCTKLSVDKYFLQTAAAAAVASKEAAEEMEKSFTLWSLHLGYLFKLPIYDNFYLQFKYKLSKTRV